MPDPRKRADLFEVARHSWLAEYATVVSHITSNTTNVSDIANTTVTTGKCSSLETSNKIIVLHTHSVSLEAHYETPLLARSASVREPPKAYQTTTSTTGDFSHQKESISQTEEQARQQRDAKRRTVQVEYVAPQSQTTRGQPSGETVGRPLAPATTQPASLDAPRTKPLPLNPAIVQESRQAAYPAVANRNQGMARPVSKELAWSISELTGAFSGTQGPPPQSTRPPTSGSMASICKLDSRLPSKGSYSQPVAPAVATANAQGRLAQPTSGKPYISAPIPIQPGTIPAGSIGQPSTQPGSLNVPQQDYKGHKRSSTVSSISEKLFGRPGSFFSSRGSQPGSPRVKPSKRYPPTSMKEPLALDSSRASMDSRRSLSLAFRRQGDGSSTRNRRFSLIPPAFFSRSSTKETLETVASSQTQPPERNDSQCDPAREERRLSTAPATIPGNDPAYGQNQGNNQGRPGSSHYQNQRNHGGYPENPDTGDYSAHIDRQFASLHGTPDNHYRHEGFANAYQGHHQSEPNIMSRGHHLSASQGRADPNKTFSTLYHGEYDPGRDNASHPSIQSGRKGNVLQKNHRKFADAYEHDRAHHSGSSGAARKVMDFFRRRGKARAGEDRY